MTTFDLTNPTKTPLGEMNEIVAIELFKCRLHDTHDFYCWAKDTKRWFFVKAPNFNPEHAYKAELKPLTKDSIDWDHVSPEYIAMVRCTRARGFLPVLCTKIPVYRNYSWEGLGKTRETDVFSSVKVGNMPVEDSLVLRPSPTT